MSDKSLFLPVRHESVKPVGTQKRWVNQMRFKIAIEPLAIDRWCCLVAFFQFGDVLRWRNTANNPVRAIGKRCLVDDRIKDIRLDAMLLAPILREDVMDVDIFAEEDRVIKFLARAKILRPSFIRRAFIPL